MTYQPKLLFTADLKWWKITTFSLPLCHKSLFLFLKGFLFLLQADFDVSFHLWMMI